MPRTRKPTASAATVIGYVRVSTDEQAESGLGLDAQRATIEAEVSRRGWTLVGIFEDAGWSAKNLARPGMTAALAALGSGDAGALVVAKLDRATRSTIDAATLLARAEREGWAFVALDLGVDTSTATGELIANIMASVAQWERRAIGARTREALNAKRVQGVRLGRPVLLPNGVTARIVAAHKDGSGWSAIARDLNAEGVPTAHGGAKWYPSTVRAVVLANTVPVTG
jgi:DNA invertase Pin-like site-specific DNA recombinase